MKKTIKTLTLNKETLRTLSEDPEHAHKTMAPATVQLCTEGTFACSYCRTC